MGRHILRRTHLTMPSGLVYSVRIAWPLGLCLTLRLVATKSPVKQVHPDHYKCSLGPGWSGMVGEQLGPQTGYHISPMHSYRAEGCKKLSYRCVKLSSLTVTTSLETLLESE